MVGRVKGIVFKILLSRMICFFSDKINIIFLRNVETLKKIAICCHFV